MSHVTSAVAKIKGVNKDLLEEVLQKLAQKYGAHLVNPNEIRDYYGNMLINAYPNIKYGMVGGMLKYGVGIEITEQGEVVVRGDFWGSRINEQQFTADLESEYTKEAIKEALVESGFTITHETEDEEEVVLMAEEVL